MISVIIKHLQNYLEIFIIVEDEGESKQDEFNAVLRFKKL